MDGKRLKKLLIGDLSFWRLGRSILSVYVCLLVIAFFWSDRLIFQPQPAGYEDSDEIIKLESAGGRGISAVHLVNPDAVFTLLFSHGNAEDLGDLREFFENYRDQGFSVFAYDYSGYGTSEGRPSTRNACQDADAALAYLVEHERVPLDRIIVHGRSVGGGPALHLAQRNRVAGVIVESSFVTAFRVMTGVPIAPFDKFRNISRIDDVGAPVLVIHGREDGVIPFWHGEALFRKAKEPKRSCWLDQAGHNSMSAESRAKYWAAIGSFADSIRPDQTRISAPIEMKPESQTQKGVP